MTVRELITKMMRYNMDADVDVIVHNQAEQFTLCHGGNKDSEGTVMENTSCVSIYVDRLCQSESNG